MRSCRSVPVQCKVRDDPHLQRYFLSSSVAILTLSYVAQALVVVIVGLNLGFRYDMLSLHSTEIL
jgi:hypothetical protein